MKLYVKPIDLELHFRNAFSNVKMSYVSNVDIDEWKKLSITFRVGAVYGFKNMRVVVKI